MDRVTPALQLDNPLVARFWAKVAIGGPDDCWEWTAAKREGYGQFWDGKKSHEAHRFIYSVTVGEIATGLVCDHLCHNRKCVNPSHLRVCSRKDNNRFKLLRKDSSTGFKGVKRGHRSQRWQARIKVDGVAISLGTFDTPELANAAYTEAARVHFGEFACGGAA